MRKTDLLRRLADLRQLRAAAKPLPEQDSRVAEVYAARDDDRRRKEFESAAMAFVYELLEGSVGGCIEGDRCVCGGDTEAVRASCGNWQAYK